MFLTFAPLGEGLTPEGKAESVWTTLCLPVFYRSGCPLPQHGQDWKNTCSCRLYEAFKPSKSTKAGRWHLHSRRETTRPWLGVVCY